MISQRDQLDPMLRSPLRASHWDWIHLWSSLNCSQ